MWYDVTNWDFDGYCAEQLQWIPALPAALGFLGPAEDGLPEHLKRQLVAGLRRIENLDPGDSFWRPHHFNRLPTMHKLGEYCQDRYETGGFDPAIAWFSLALHVRYCMSPHIPEHPLWELEEPDKLTTRWLVEAAWLEEHCWGDTGRPMRAVARRLGREASFMEAIDAVEPADDVRLAAWILRERALS